MGITHSYIHLHLYWAWSDCVLCVYFCLLLRGKIYNPTNQMDQNQRDEMDGILDQIRLFVPDHYTLAGDTHCKTVAQ